MQDRVTIVRLEQLEALADPLRQRLLRAFCCRSATTKQVAEMLGEKPSRLYHHVEVLEKAGLLRLERTQPNRGTLEKYYATVAMRFEVDRELLRAASPEMLAAAESQSAIANGIIEGMAELRRWLGARDASGAVPEGASVLFHGCCTLTESQAQALVARLQECVGECREEARGGESGRRYSVTVAFHESMPECGAEGVCGSSQCSAQDSETECGL